MLGFIMSAVVKVIQMCQRLGIDPETVTAEDLEALEKLDKGKGKGKGKGKRKARKTEPEPEPDDDDTDTPELPYSDGDTLEFEIRIRPTGSKGRPQVIKLEGTVGFSDAGNMRCFARASKKSLQVRGCPTNANVGLTFLPNAKK